MSNANEVQISGVLSPWLINVHMRAAGGESFPQGAGLRLMHKGGELHLITTNNALLLHTTIDAREAQCADCPDFDTIALVTRKIDALLPVSFRVADRLIIFESGSYVDAFRICDATKYLDVAKAEGDPAALEYPQVKPFDPALLAIVRDYLGDDSAACMAYMCPMQTKRGAYRYHRYDGGGIKTRTATLLPLKLRY